MNTFMDVNCQTILMELTLFCIKAPKNNKFHIGFKISWTLKSRRGDVYPSHSPITCASRRREINLHDIFFTNFVIFKIHVNSFKPISTHLNVSNKKIHFRTQSEYTLKIEERSQCTMSSLLLATISSPVYLSECCLLILQMCL